MIVHDMKNNKTMNVMNANELSNIVNDTVSYYQDRCERLEKEVKDWRTHSLEKANAELIDANQSLRDQLYLSYGEFASKKEKMLYNHFVEEHMHDRETSKYNGGRAPYLIPNHTGIGTILHVKCPICGAEENITDTEVW